MITALIATINGCFGTISGNPTPTPAAGPTATPGTISLKGEDGTTYGPWQATGANAQGGVKNAYWLINPNVTLKAGKYTIVDSDPSTWATNSGANDAGMANVRYIPS